MIKALVERFPHVVRNDRLIIPATERHAYLFMNWMSISILSSAQASTITELRPAPVRSQFVTIYSNGIETFNLLPEEYVQQPVWYVMFKFRPFSGLDTWENTNELYERACQYINNHLNF